MTLLEAIRCRIHYCRGGVHCPECEAEKPVPRRKYCVKYVGGRHRIEYAQATPVKQVGGRTVSSKSKTGDPKCSAAVSAWKTGKATSETHKQLAQCRVMARMAGQAHFLRAGEHFAKAQHIEHLLSSGKPITKKERAAKAKELRGQRSERIAEKAAPAEPAKPAEPVPASVKPAASADLTIRSLRDKSARHEKIAEEREDALTNLRRSIGKGKKPTALQEQLGRRLDQERMDARWHAEQSREAADRLEKKASRESDSHTPAEPAKPAEPAAPSDPSRASIERRNVRQPRPAVKLATPAEREQRRGAFQPKSEPARPKAIAGKVGVGGRKELAESKKHELAARRLARSVRAHEKAGHFAGPLPGEAEALKQLREKNLAALQEHGAKVKALPRRTTEVGRASAEAFTAAMQARQQAETGWQGTADPELRGKLFQQAEQKYREAQPKLKAYREQIRARETPISTRSSEEMTGQMGPTRGETKSIPTRPKTREEIKHPGPEALKAWNPHEKIKELHEREAQRKATIPPAEFAARVQSAAARVGPEGRFGAGKVFIHHAHRAYEQAHGPIPLAEFKAKLLEANTGRHLDLARADMVEAMKPEDVEASHTRHPSGASFNFIRSEARSIDPLAKAKQAHDRLMAEYQARASKVEGIPAKTAIYGEYMGRLSQLRSEIDRLDRERRAALEQRGVETGGRAAPTYDPRSGGYFSGD